MADLTPWTWILAAMASIEAMPWWQETGIDRTPRLTHGIPLGFLDECDCDESPFGQVLVTAGEVFYSGERFPESDLIASRISTCSDTWATKITIDYARCRPVVNSRGENPSIAERYEFASGLYADGMAIWSALHCAVPGWRQEFGSVIARGWSPITRELGPCAGFSFEFTGKVKSCEEC